MSGVQRVGIFFPPRFGRRHRLEGASAGLRAGFDWPNATAFLTALAALLSAIYTWETVRETRFALRVTTLQNLEREFFDGANMHPARRRAAAALLKGEAT